MKTGACMTLPRDHDVIAPDGSEVRILLSLAGGSMAHFLLPAGQTSRAVRHRTVEEIWYVLSGTGEMWQSDGNDETVSLLLPGVCVTIPAGVRFQFRCLMDTDLAAVAITMPPWPGDTEAEVVDGKWEPGHAVTVSPKSP
jgi:mannose-6-phosphate isomerase-like protein (cupin superfamily)